MNPEVTEQYRVAAQQAAYNTVSLKYHKYPNILPMLK